MNNAALPTLPPEETNLLASFKSNLMPSLRLLLDRDLFAQVRAMAQIMATDTVFTPKHLVGKEAGCITVINMALNWNLDPQFVARCTYVTPGGSIGFEGKLVQAVLEASNRFVGGPKITYVGDWSRLAGKFEKATSARGNEFIRPTWTAKDAEGLGIIVRWQVKGEDEPRAWPGEDEPFFLVQCYPLNSPLWASDPKTQIRYLGMRRFADMAAPGILAGAPFDAEDLLDASERAKDVTPPPRPTREQFTATEPEPPYEVVDMIGEWVRYAELDEAVSAYNRLLDIAEQQQGERGLTAVWDNNQGFMRMLDEEGHALLTARFSEEYGKRRQAAAAKDAKDAAQHEGEHGSIKEGMADAPADGGGPGASQPGSDESIRGGPETAAGGAQASEAATRAAEVASEPSTPQAAPTGKTGPLGLGVPPRSAFWDQPSYLIPPPTDLAGKIDWEAYCQMLGRLIWEASEAEIKKLWHDNEEILQTMAHRAPDAYGALELVIETRQKEL